MLDKFKSKDRKELESFLGKENPFGSYNRMFGGMETFLSGTAIFMAVIATVACIKAFGFSYLGVTASVIVWLIMGFLVFKLKTE